MAVPKTEPSDLAGGLANTIKPAMKRIPRESSSLAHRSSLRASASLIDKKSLGGQPSLFDLFDLSTFKTLRVSLSHRVFLIVSFSSCARGCRKEVIFSAETIYLVIKGRQNARYT